MNKRTVAMSADYGYINNVTTTIKSLLYNNPLITIYLINSDIPQEWFKEINQKINQIGSQIKDIKIDPNLLANEHISQSHLAAAGYGKLLIPDLINEDHVVYLDSDVIVDGNIDYLFNLDLDDDQLYAAGREIEGSDHFNDGILVVNNKALKQIDHLTDQLLKIGQDDNLRNSDQSVFNQYFENKIVELPLTYNYESGMDRWASVGNRTDMLDQLDSLDHPLIIHYVTDDKPWNFTSSDRFRYKWWHYFGISWEEIINKYLPQLKDKQILPTKSFGNLLNFTNDQNLDHLEELVKALPNWDFHIAAASWMGWNLNRMVQYPNTHIYPIITSHNLSNLISQCDAYLDINYGSKRNDIIQGFQKTGKPMLTFTDVASQLADNSNYHIFEQDDIKGMINMINGLNSKEE